MVYIVLICLIFGVAITHGLTRLSRHNKSIVLLPSILLTTLCAILLLNYWELQEITVLKLSTFFIFTGACFVLLIGILYDFKRISIKTKRYTEGAIALCYPIIGLYINDVHGFLVIDKLPLVVSYIVTFCLILLITTVLTHMSKTKGISTGYSIMTSVILGVYFFFYGREVFVILATALTGTLLVLYNIEMWSLTKLKNKAFMSTSSLMILSFALSYLALKASMNTALNPDPDGKGFILTLSLLFVPSVDLAWKEFLPATLYRKGLRNEILVGSYIGMTLLCVLINGILFFLNFSVTWIVIADIVYYAAIRGMVNMLKDKEVVVTEEKIEDTIRILERNEVPAYKLPNLVNTDIKISIIIATYNSAETLEDTLKSILEQTYQNYEVMLCDGLSTDSTMEIVEKYYPLFGEKLKAVSEADNGIYDAMNKGIDLATGDVVGILNSDDFYTSKFVLERIVKTFKTYPLLEAVYGDVHYVKPNNLQRTVRYYSSKHFRPIFMQMGFMPAHPSFYCLKEVYSTYGKYNLNYKVAADFDQLLRLLFIYRIRAQYVNMDFVTMRTGGASSSGIRSHLQIMKDHTKSMHSYGMSASYFLFSIRYVYKCVSIVAGKIKRLL